MNTKNTTYIKQPEGGLLQSHEWAELLRAEGKDVINIFDVYCIIHKLSFVGTYTYIPRAYDIDEKKIDALMQKTRSHGAGWMRIDVCEKELLDIFDAKNIKYTKAPHDMQPRENLIIDINLLEDELLSQMKSKTRYNIRLATKKGVKVFTSRDKKYVDIFCDLVEKTAKRKGVTFHNKEHYHKMFQKIPKNMMQLYIAQYDGEIIAANIISFYGGTATYLHGATSDKQRNVMAPFLLQWRAMLDAKAKECQWYDFGGIFSKNSDSGKKGITRFKKGFSPDTSPFVTEGSYDIIFSLIKYKAYCILQQIKK